MIKKHCLSLSLLLLNYGFSEEIEPSPTPFPESSLTAEYSPSSSPSQTTDLTSSKTQKQPLAEKQALLVRKEKELADQEEALQIEEEELSDREDKLAERVAKITSREQQLISRQEELEKEQCLLSDEDPSSPLYTTQNAPAPVPNPPPSIPAPTSKPPSSAPECTMFHTMHLGLRHTEARGVGYKDGYTTLEAFGIYDRNDDLMPFFDIRGHVFDDGKLAGNAGIGGRSYLSSLRHLFGYYCYYDVRQTRYRLTAQQISPGLELLGNRMEYRVNGYFPMGKDTSNSHRSGFSFDSFKGHNIFLKSKYRHVSVFTGGDAEVGVHLTQSMKYDAYLGAGPYYFSGSHASSWGGKVRLLGRYKEYLSLEASYSYDHLFRSIVQGSIALNLPFGCKFKDKKRPCHANLALSRAAFSPYRFEIPVVKKASITKREKAINPATGAPWNVWFVDNTSSSNGTFESPFPTLVQAQIASAPNDMIYVFPGDGTTKGMNLGIALQDGQTFFGSGIAHNIPTTKGIVTLPAFSQTYPSITNINGSIFGGNVVVPANGNEISGFNIIVSTSGNSAIFSPADIQGITIDHNNISTIVAENSGVAVSGSGNMAITNNQFSGISGNPLTAIGLTPNGTGSTLTGQVSNNSISNYEIGVIVGLSDTSTVDLEISNNTISHLTGFGAGISLGIHSGIPGTSNALITGNNISNFSGGGILIGAVGAVSTISIIGNTINNNTGAPFSNGILCSFSLPFNTSDILISDNRVSTSTSSSNTRSIMATLNSPSALLDLEIANNQVNIASSAGSSPSGIVIASGPGTVCATITDNQVTVQAPPPATTTGIKVSTSGSGIVNIDDFSGNTAPNINASGNNINFVAPGTCNP